MQTKLDIVRTGAKLKMTYKEIAVRFSVKERVVRDLMHKLRKKPDYFVKEAGKNALYDKRETATVAVVGSLLESQGYISSMK